MYVTDLKALHHGFSPQHTAQFSSHVEKIKRQMHHIVGTKYWMSSCCQSVEDCLPVWIFDGFDWCEAAWLQLGVADVFEGSFCQWIDSVVTWVASYWLISLLIVWLQPWGSLTLPRDTASSINTKQLKIKNSPCPVLHSKSSLHLSWGGFFFVCSCFGR